MTTAIDSSVLLAIFNGEPGADRWLETLIRARQEGRLVICAIEVGHLMDQHFGRVIG